MAKVRLNNDKRDALRRLAMDKLQDTPLPEEIEAKLSEARSAFLAAYPVYVAEGKKALKSMYPLAVVKKYNEIGRVSMTSRITCQHQGEFFDICMPLEHGAHRTTINGLMIQQYFACKLGCMTNDLNSVAQQRGKDIWSDAMELTKGNFWFVPETGRYKFNLKTGERVGLRAGGESRFVDKTGAAFKAYKAMKDAEEKLEAAEREAEQHTYQLRRSFAALIDGAKTLEDVSAVWSEAEELRDTFVAENQLPTLISDEAKNMIAQNVAARSK